MSDMDVTFYCERREMPVLKDTTDCWGCTLKNYPSPCQQYIAAYKAMKAGQLGYIPGIYQDDVGPTILEPAKPRITE